MTYNFDLNVSITQRQIALEPYNIYLQWPTNGKFKVVYDLLNGAIFKYLEPQVVRPQPTVSMLRHSLSDR